MVVPAAVATVAKIGRDKMPVPTPVPSVISDGSMVVPRAVDGLKELFMGYVIQLTKAVPGVSMTTVSEDRSAPSSPAEKPAGTATPSKVAVPVRIVTVQLNAPTGIAWVWPAAFRYVERVPERGTATTADVIFGAVPSGPLMTGSILVYAATALMIAKLSTASASSVTAPVLRMLMMQLPAAVA